jgi:hypothetical protein
MTLGELTQRLESSRWAPYRLGALASLPMTVVMLLFWIYFPVVAIVWSFVYPFWAGLDVFTRTPLRKMISMALFVGTLTPFAIWFWVVVPWSQNVSP